jgi:hypothetical protein
MNRARGRWRDGSAGARIPAGAVALLLLLLTGTVGGASLSGPAGVGPPTPANVGVLPVGGSVARTVVPLEHAATVRPTGPTGPALGQHPLAVHSAPPPGWGPHRAPPPATHPASYSGHYYAGAQYTGTNSTAHELATNLTLPSDVPQAGDFYYVILSAWDDAGSYDQIGFTNDFGTWGLAYSYTDYCGSTYYYSAGAIPLPPGATYRFSMSLANGIITYRVANQSSPNFWSLTAQTGGSVFEVAAFYTCGGYPYYDYTDYEEVYYTTDNLPPYPFYFVANTVDGGAETSWSGFTLSAPSNISVLVQGDNVTIANEPYALGYPANGSSRRLVESGDPVRAFNDTLRVSALVTDLSLVRLSVAVLPTGWTASLTPASGQLPITSRLTYTLPSGTPTGGYAIGVLAVDVAGSPARASFWVDVIAHVAVSVRASAATRDVGQNVTFTAIASHGEPGYAYAWSSVPSSACANSTAPTLLCAPSQAGTLRVSVLTVDAAGYSVVGTLAFTVYADPVLVLAPPRPASGGVDVGQLVVFSANVTGGPGGNGYAWSGLPGCAALQFPTLSCRPSAAGNFSVEVRVTDANNFMVRAVVPYAVRSDPTLAVAIAPRPTLDVGQTLVGALAATGGAGGYGFSWSGLPSNCSGNQSFQCVATSVGKFVLHGSVADANGFLVTTAAMTVTVSPALIARFNVTHPSVTVGGWFAVDLAPAGGLGPVTVRWSGAPAECPAGANWSWTCTPARPGVYHFSGAIVDANNATLWANATVEVWSTIPPSTTASTETAWVVGPGVIVIAVAAVFWGRRPRAAARSAAAGPAAPEPGPE